MQRNGPELVIQSPAGVQYKRNVAHTKKYIQADKPETPKSDTQAQSPEIADNQNLPDTHIQIPQSNPDVPDTPKRPSRVNAGKLSKYYDDFVMDN